MSLLTSVLPGKENHILWVVWDMHVQVGRKQLLDGDNNPLYFPLPFELSKNLA